MFKSSKIAIRILGILSIIIIVPALLFSLLFFIVGLSEKEYSMTFLGLCLIIAYSFGLFAIKKSCFKKNNAKKYCVHCGAELRNRFDVCEKCGCVLDEHQVLMKHQQFPITNVQNPKVQQYFGNTFKIRTFDPYKEYGIRKYKTDISSANLLLKKLRETVNMLDTTTKPDVFFKRLHYSFDILLELLSYKDNVFSSKCTPLQQFWQQYDYIEKRVDNFITRSYIAALQSVDKLKTEKAKNKKMEDYFIKLLAAFDYSYLFWEGSANFPHYIGMLYTEDNLKRAEKMSDDFFESKKEFYYREELCQK